MPTIGDVYAKILRKSEEERQKEAEAQRKYLEDLERQWAAFQQEWAAKGVKPEFAVRFPSAAQALDAINQALVAAAGPVNRAVDVGYGLIKRSSEASVESLFSAPGAVGEMQGGYTTTGIPALDVAAWWGGSAAGTLAQFLAAQQFAGAGLAALGKAVPQAARVSQLAPSVVRTAGRGAATALTRMGMQAALASEEGKPTARDVAQEVAFQAAAGPAGAVAGRALERAYPAIHPLVEAPIVGAAAAAGGGAAAYPFSGKPVKEYLKDMGPQMIAMAVLNTVMAAGAPETWKPRVEFGRQAVRFRQLHKDWLAALDAGDDALANAKYRDLMEVKDAMYTAARRAKVPEDILGSRTKWTQQMEEAIKRDLTRRGWKPVVEQAPQAQPQPEAEAPAQLAPVKKVPIQADADTVADVLAEVAQQQQRRPPVTQAPVTPRIQPPAAITEAPTVPAAKPYEGLTPGAPEWKRVWQERPELQREMLEYAKKVRMQQAAKPAPAEAAPVATGKPATVRTERGTAVDTKYAVVDAKALISSHDTALRPDPRFPAELQPRERARAASEEQITRIANRLEPEFLGESPKASEGAPIVGPDGVVESGNARVIALKRVYEQNKPGVQKYKAWLLENAERFGLDKAAIERVEAPVLVRIRQTALDREQFVREANEAAVAAMSATEQATTDAKKISGGLMNLFRPNDEGEIATVANRDFIRGFLDRVVGPTERGRYVTAEGGLSQEGIARIRNAVFARAYGDPTAIAKLAESPDNNVRNITGAMLIAAPRLADVKERIAQRRLFDLDITGDIAAAMRKLSELRERGERVEAYLEQRSMFGEEELSPFSKEILRAFSKYATSRKKVTELLLAYADAVEAAGDPSQGVLFGERTAPTKQEALQAALEVMEVRYGEQGVQASLFGGAGPSVRGPAPGAPGTGEVGARGEGAQGYPGTGAPAPVATAPSLPRVEQELRSEVDKAIEEVSPPAGMSVRMVTKPPPEAPRAEKHMFSDPEIEARWKAAQGVQRPPLSARLREFTASLYRKATREFEHLPRTAEFAPLRFGLLRLQKQKDVAADRTLRMQQGVTVNLDPARMDLFTRKVILDDLAHEAEKGHDLPFGFTPESLAKEKARIDEAAAQDQLVAEAVRKRRTAWEAVKKDYADAMKAIGFDVSDRLKNEDYFRHQVLEYAQVKSVSGTGRKLRTPTGRGFLKKREGSALDINTDYLQAEFEVMAQMLYDTEVARTIKLVDEKYNIADKLKAQAKEQSTPEKPVDWRTLIPEGYTTWQPREGSVFFLTTSIPAKLAEMLTKGALEEVGLTAEDLRPVLAVGGPRREFVVKQEVADTLDNLTRPPETNALAIASKEITRGWKVWQLISPRRWFKYNFRNLSGDAEAVFVGNPSAFRKVPQAIRELYQVFAGDRPMSEEMAEWFQRGGMQTLLQVQELGDINKLRMFQHLYEAKGTAKEVPLKVWQAYWKAARLSTDFREAILRYAAYLDYLEQMRNDPKGRPRNFGASVPEEVMALDDIRDRAFMLSNDLLGAYDRVSVIGQELREHLLPFWSWQEVNFRRYVQLAKNAAREGRTASALGRKLLGTAVRSPLIAFNVGKFALKALALWGMLTAWNYIFFRDEEEDLPPEVQGRAHIVLGRDPDGKVKYFDRLGMLNDFLEWFGLDEAPMDVRDWLNGKRTLREIAADVAKAPVNKLVGQVTPLIKAPAEALTRRKLYPDVFRPGRIRDVGLHIAQSLGLDAEYRAVAGLPSRPYTESLETFFLYKTDPGEAAYWAIIDEKERFLKKIGKWTGGYSESQRSYALYNYKTALRYKDKAAAERYLGEYFLLGGTRQGLQRSLDSMDPLYGLKGADRARFLESLREEDRKRLALAQDFYRKMRYGQ